MLKRSCFLISAILLILLAGSFGLSSSGQYDINEIPISLIRNEMPNIVTIDRRHIVSAAGKFNSKVELKPTVVSVKIADLDGSLLTQNIELPNYGPLRVDGELNGDFFSFYAYDDLQQNDLQNIKVFGAAIGMPYELLHEALFDRNFQPQFFLFNNELSLMFVDESGNLSHYLLESSEIKQILLTDSNTQYQLVKHWPVVTNGQDLAFLAEDSSGQASFLISDGEQIISIINLPEENSSYAILDNALVPYALLDQSLLAFGYHDNTYTLYSLDYKNSIDWQLLKTSSKGYFRPLGSNGHIALGTDHSRENRLLAINDNNEYQYITLPKEIDAKYLIVNPTTEKDTFVLFSPVSYQFFVLNISSF